MFSSLKDTIPHNGWDKKPDHLGENKKLWGVEHLKRSASLHYTKRLYCDPVRFVFFLCPVHPKLSTLILLSALFYILSFLKCCMTFLWFFYTIFFKRKLCMYPTKYLDSLILSFWIFTFQFQWTWHLWLRSQSSMLSCIFCTFHSQNVYATLPCCFDNSFTLSLR